MATATIAEQVEELEGELETVYAQVEEALKLIDNGQPDEAAEILADLLQDDEDETTDEEG